MSFNGRFKIETRALSNGGSKISNCEIEELRADLLSPDERVRESPSFAFKENDFPLRIQTKLKIIIIYK